ncbi:hypothetical protein [Wenjunlia tyrosinilytica]|uniref:Uncharacterized protein n=1 Tax=Wenjunlia tyrosinilytica TaxID=1544741 RepID=A0A917ZQ64_9ACTN|nr:hypothetical protein [Wenjunlia tyrosinilytica]GGO89352.1 hypothetical protein GCM10012280_32260 [Wenjunlia tyrosinilytica]
MVDTVLLLVLLLLSGWLLLTLLRSALRRWQMERSGLVYELPANYRAALLRLAAAAAVLAVTTGTAVAVVTRNLSRPGPVVAAPATTGSPSHTHRPANDDAEPHRAAPATRAPRTIGHPARGTLQRLPGTRAEVWLPAVYSSRTGNALAYPVVIAHIPVSAATELFEAFDRYTLRGLSHPFIVAVAPDCGPVEPSTGQGPTAGETAIDKTAMYKAAAGETAVDKSAVGKTSTDKTSTDKTATDKTATDKTAMGKTAVGKESVDKTGDEALERALEAHYRVLRGRTGRAVLGLDTTGPCALASVLRHPDRFRAAAAISSSRGGQAAGLPVSAPPAASDRHLALLSATTDTAARRAAYQLRAKLAPFADTRIVDSIGGTGAADVRRHLFAVASQYLTEQLGPPQRR